MSNRFILFFLGLLFSLLTVKTFGQGLPPRDSTARSVFNYCQKMSYPLATVSGSAKDVPHTIVKNTGKYFLLGYSDYYSPSQGYRPTFRIRDRFQNEIAGYSITALSNLLDEVGSGDVYLTDISEILEEKESFFITGFVVPHYPNPVDANTTCIPFIAEISFFTGDVIQATALHNNTVPYNILVNQEGQQVVIVGEEYKEQHFNPMTSMAFAHTEAPGQGIIICVRQDDVSDVIWSYKASLDLNQSMDNNAGSLFEKVSLTPYGYCISGNMTMKNAPNPFYPYSNRIEGLLIDFSGNILWQKSIKTTNSMSRAVSAYYSSAYDKIFMLFHDTYAHAFGLFAIDPISGAHGPLSYVPLSGETNPSNILTKNPDSEVITVGGMVSNYMSSMGYSSSVFSPFFIRLKFDPNSETFNVNGSSGDDFLVVEDGIDYSAPDFSSYFAFSHNSFNMFDVDKRYVQHLPEQETYLFASKNVDYQTALLYKLNYNHCYCQTFRGSPATISYNLPDSPTVKLREWPVEPRQDIFMPHERPLDGDLICGEADDPYWDIYKGSKTFNPAKPVIEGNVAVFDILGRELYRGTYESFINSATKYAVAEGQVLIIVNQSNGKSQKVVFVK